MPTNSANLIAKSTVSINASKSQVWSALIDPEAIKAYMFGTIVISDWKVGSDITWKGEWKGKSYQDKGKIVTVENGKELAYTHFSPLTGDEDKPENYKNVVIKLAGDEDNTTVALTQDGCKNEEEVKHSEETWSMMLKGLKKFVEEKN